MCHGTFVGKLNHCAEANVILQCTSFINLLQFYKEMVYFAT